MNFDLTEDEQMLKVLAERFVTDHYDMEKRRLYAAQANGFSIDNWALLGELGLIAALAGDEAMGMDLDATAIATIFEALGHGLAIEPLIENVLLSARLFLAHAPEPLRGAWANDLVTGTRRVALAHAEADGRGGRLWVETRARSEGEAFLLSGAKAYVAAGAGVDGYLVSARTAGAADAEAGLGLYFVAADAPGLTAQPWRMADGSAATALTLRDVAAHELATGPAELAAAQTLAGLARCAEAVGIMDRMMADTLDYLRTREQFGMPLSSFQALQHRMVGQYAALEECRALVNLAQVSYGTADFARTVEGARAFIGETSLTLGHEMIQFHGGMGVTDELAIGHGHKRLLVLSRWPETADTALDRFAGVA